MKLFRTILAAGVLAAPASVFASSGDALSVHVPFAFVLAGQEFAPGNYRVQQSDNGILLVRGEGKAAMTLTIPASAPRAGVLPALEFKSTDAREHLISVQMEGAVKRVIPQPAPERVATFTASSR